MNNTTMPKNQFEEPKCLSRPVFCAQKQKLPGPNISFPEVFYSHSIRSQEEEQNKRMKERVRGIVEKYGCRLTDAFSESPRGTFQYFCNNICLKIQRSTALIADVTPIDGQIASNIIHEIGLAQGFRKNIALVTCSKEFDAIEKFVSNLKGFEIFLFPEDLDRLYDLMGEILKHALPEIHIISDAREFQYYSLQLEERPFNRDFYSTLIPSMMRAEEDKLTVDIVNRRKIYPFRDDEIYTAQYVDTLEARREAFSKLLRDSKEGSRKVTFRDIYITNALNKYSRKGIMEGKEIPDDKDEVISRLNGLIYTLDNYYPHYQIGLVSLEAPYKFYIKHGCGVIIDNPARRISKDALAIFSTIKSFIAENQNLFNRLWEIPNTPKTPHEVIPILKDFLTMAEKRS